MTKARDFAKKVSETTVYTANTVQRVMEAISASLFTELQDGRRVDYPGLGVFYPRRIPPKKYTNPRTKRKEISQEKKIVGFKPLPRKKVL